MIQEYEIAAISDIGKLDEQQFKRFLPDLIAWWRLCRDLAEVGATPTSMVWVDDGRPGEIHSVELTIKESGEKTTFPGSAWRGI